MVFNVFHGVVLIEFGFFCEPDLRIQFVHFLNCSHQRDQEVVSLQQQLQVLAQQRDDAVFKLSTTQDEMEQTQHELSNLQMVLEQFQKGA